MQPYSRCLDVVDTRRRIRMAVVRSSTADFDPTFYNVQELGMARALASHGVSTDIYVSLHATRGKTTFDFPKIADVRVLPLPGTVLPGHQATLAGLVTHLKRRRYDVVQVHEDFTMATVVAAECANRTGSTVVLRQGVYEDYSGALSHSVQSLWDRIALPRLRRSVHAVAAKSRAAARYSGSKGFGDLNVIPVGVDDAAFRDSADIKWHDALGLGQATRIVLYVGELSARRAFETVLEAFGGSVHGNVGDLCLVIVTRSTITSSINCLLERTQIPYRVLHDIPQASLPSLYRAAWMFVLLSSYEIWGMAAAESLLFGTPVVVSDTGGLRDILGHAPAGTLVKENSVTAWRQALGCALRADAHAAMKEAAVQRGKQLTCACIAPSYAAFLRRSMSKHARKQVGLPRRSHPAQDLMDAHETASGVGP